MKISRTDYLSYTEEIDAEQLNTREDEFQDLPFDALFNHMTIWSLLPKIAVCQEPARKSRNENGYYTNTALNINSYSLPKKNINSYFFTKKKIILTHTNYW